MLGVYDTVRMLESAGASARIVWLVLATLRDPQTNQIATSLASLQELTGLPGGRVLSGLNRLSQSGLVEGEFPVLQLTTVFTTVPAANLEFVFPRAVLPKSNDIDTPDALMAAWNAGAPHLLPCVNMTPQRRERAWSRLHQYTGVKWPFVIARLDASSFCRGSNSNGWKAGFDFLLREATVAKTLEGVYDDRPESPVSEGNAKAAATWLTHRRKRA